ncbi:murein biosynthesis integral membrane protein MurJ [Helicobacter turcicus]|uniref:Probable lipid II flippase MurJ n=1 Tax=Helicobacter turcicus TaxID=2867412 RepID=A0ABS7JLT6_9HELI|nr:murein biosynthesis integral membrane protein MurJ [Helicobacter turcicus]MBX7490357.1 murein biosynthesis integral membrane protein MurJ [Helicobacter turcicus]MBX7545064.1 murein biosynthesis integral membrane protein MurJ [Helicobacter turcicus]
MFLRGFFTNSSGILTSRILGFFRDFLTANTLGAGIYSDMFFVAFKLPNLFRRVFGEGAFNQSFLPGFFKARFRGGFALKIGLIFCVILLLLSLIVTLFSMPITKLLAFGFSDELITLTAPLVAINFWYLLLVFIVTFLGAMLQYKRNFTAWAYSPALLNLAMIIALLLVQNSNAYDAVLILSYAVLAGGIAQIALHFIPIYRLGFLKLLLCGFRELKDSANSLHKQNRKSSINTSVKDFFKQFFPAMLGSSTAQIASFIDTLLASFLASGSISYLYYANRLFQLPLAIFAIATSTALFPLVAKYIKESKENEAIKTLTKSFWLLLILLSICTLGGILLRNEIIWLLFERGKFMRTDTLICSSVFGAYLIGLLPFGLAKIFSLWLYSKGQQILAAKISAISLAIGTLFSLILMQFFGAMGLALAGSISGFIVFFLTLHHFGWQTFFQILWNPKFILITCGILVLESLIILAFKQYIFSL